MMNNLSDLVRLVTDLVYQPLHQSKLINQLRPGETIQLQSHHPAQQEVAASPVASSYETTRDNQRPSPAQMTGLRKGWWE
jgi:hypothetical protein